MERSSLYQNAPIFIMFVWMMATQILIPFDWMLRYAVNMVGMVVCVSFLVVTNEVLKWKSAEFTHIDCIVRPSGDRLHLFARSIRTVELEAGIFGTALELGVGVNHSFYGPIPKGGHVVFLHTGEWENRMGELGQGKAVFMGQIVDHPQSTQVVLYEPQGVFDMEWLQPVPVFRLANAPNDYKLPDDMVNFDFNSGDIMDAKFTVEGVDKVLGGPLPLTREGVEHAVTKMMKKIENLQLRNYELQRQSYEWHTKAVSTMEVNGQLKTELNALQSPASDMVKSVVELFLLGMEAHADIEEGFKMFKPSNWITRGLIVGVVALLAVAVFMLNPDSVLSFLSVRTNQFFMIMMGVLVVAVYYFRSRISG